MPAWKTASGRLQNRNDVPPPETLFYVKGIGLHFDVRHVVNVYQDLPGNSAEIKTGLVVIDYDRETVAAFSGFHISMNRNPPGRNTPHCCPACPLLRPGPRKPQAPGGICSRILR